MSQYRKLFDKSEIEYITPFLKLWMSFNNWYKQDLENARTDRAAINEYKNQGSIKRYFLQLLNAKSIKEELFQNALAEFVKLINEFSSDNLNYSDDMFFRHPSKEDIENEGLVYISPNNKEYYFSDGDEERFFEETLENIYQIRCSLVHGDFDIDNQLFINLVEKSYLILYPIMEKIFENTED